MAFISVLTSTDCALWPFPFRNYDLIALTTLCGSHWKGVGLILGSSSRTRSRDFCVSWKDLRSCWHCDDLGVCHWLLIQSYSIVGHIRSTSPIRTLRHRLDQLFSNCIPRNSGVPCGMSVLPRGNFGGNRTFPVCLHRHLGDLVTVCADRREEFYWAPNLTLHNRKAVYK
jgi:hypothetical protein